MSYLPWDHSYTFNYVTNCCFVIKITFQFTYKHSKMSESCVFYLYYLEKSEKSCKKNYRCNNKILVHYINEIFVMEVWNRKYEKI